MRAKKKALGSCDSGISRKAVLDVFCNGNKWLSPFYAPHTFEVDFIGAGNCEKVVNILEDVYTDEATVATSRDELMSDNISISGKRMLTMAKHSGKGWFAILLGKAVDHHTVIPKYIIDAVFFAHGRISNKVVFKILSYRLMKIVNDLDANRNYVAATREQPEKWCSDWQGYITSRQESINEFKLELQKFNADLLSFDQIRTITMKCFPDDKINPVLASI